MSRPTAPQIAAGLAVAAIGYASLVAVLADPTHVVVCDVKMRAECVDGGARMRRVSFPARDTAASLHANLRALEASPSMSSCLEWVDWESCSTSLIVGAPHRIGQWRNLRADGGADFAGAWNEEPLPCVRGGPGKTCLRRRMVGFDGGVVNRDIGRAVTPRAQAVNPNDCESVACSVLLGDDPEEVL